MSWKTVAIIFIILFTVETMAFVFIINLGRDVIKKEQECIQMCLNKWGSVYYYDEVTEVCSCFDEKGDPFSPNP